MRLIGTHPRSVSTGVSLVRQFAPMPVIEPPTPAAT